MDSNSIQTLRWKDVEIVICDRQIDFQYTHLVTLPRFEAVARTENVPHFIIKEGESNKDMDQCHEILDWLARNNCTRGSVIAIRGGGLALDMAGFTSAIYMRGVACKYIPTTLLSMVDAAVGGKTGVNLGAKNLVGVIKQPTQIVAALEHLKSLDRRQFINGMAEVVKMAFVYDKQFFQWLEQLSPKELFLDQNLRKIVRFGIQTKINVVEKDVDEKHERKWLNFGHTLGHAIEFLTEPGLKHGESVAIGMVLANRIAEQLSIISRQNSKRLVKLLNKLGLPTKMPDSLNPEHILDLLKKDKKRSSDSTFDFVLVRKIGQRQQTTTKVSKQLVMSLIDPTCEVSLPSKLVPLASNFEYPTSKSQCLRLLYLSASAYIQNPRTTQIKNFLESEDTEAMKGCLISLGFTVKQTCNSVKVTKYTKTEKGILDVKNSGITARFVVLLCAHLGGDWQVTCAERMQQRPNKQIFDILVKGGVQVQYLGKPHSFPVRLRSQGLNFKSDLSISSKSSSQFLSSILLILPLLKKKPKIAINDKASANEDLTSRSYIDMTLQLMNVFGVDVKVDKDFSVFSQQGCQEYSAPESFEAEVDLSSLSYPYTLSLLNNLPLPKLPTQTTQGDILFYEYLTKVQSTKHAQNYYELDFNNCTDTFMTMAVYAVLALKPHQSIKIMNIANQRVKESDRIFHIINNLKSVGAKVVEEPTSITVFGGYDSQLIKARFQSANDHRLAMSSSILGLTLCNRHPGFRFTVSHKNSVDKTFPAFWDYVKQLGASISSSTLHAANAPVQAESRAQQGNQLIFIVGMRGVGKTTQGKYLAKKLGYHFIDLDEVITENYIKAADSTTTSIKQFVEKHGMPRFRQMEVQVLRQIVKQFSTLNRSLVVSTGGGIVESPAARAILKRQFTIYLQKYTKDLVIKDTPNRAALNASIQEVFKHRQPLFLQVASYIVTQPEGYGDLQNKHFFVREFKRIKGHLNKGQYSIEKQEAYIACLTDAVYTPELQQYDSVEIRVDHMLKRYDMRTVRQKISQFKMKWRKPIILTVRSESEMGVLPDSAYSVVHADCSKIPANYIDCQVAKITPTSLEAWTAAIWSYHGREPFYLQKLRQIQQRSRRSLTKVCLTPQSEEDIRVQNIYLRNRQYFDICLILGRENRHTRVWNKLKMVSLQEGSSKTGIMTMSEMKTLTSLLRKLK